MTKSLAAIFPAYPSYGAPYKRVGTITLLRGSIFHNLAQYPGADVDTDCQPQTVDLLSNGYMAQATFTGTVVRRGYYGGELNVPGTHYWSTYAYNVDAFLGEPHDCHRESNIVASTQRAWGDLYKITLD